MTASLSVIIPSFKSREQLGPTLQKLSESVDNAALQDKIEILVIDSYPDDQIQSCIDRSGLRVKLVQEASRLFASQARNKGARAATSSRLAFLDADLLVSLEWIQFAVSVDLEKSTYSGPVFIQNASADWATALHFTEFPEFLSQGEKRLRFPPSGNLVVGKEDFLARGGFNEALKICEDIALTTSLKGFDFHYHPNLSVWHQKHLTQKTDLLEKQKKSGYWRGFYDRSFEPRFKISEKKAFQKFEPWLGQIFYILVLVRIFQSSKTSFLLAIRMPLKMFSLCSVWARSFKKGLQESRP